MNGTVYEGGRPWGGSYNHALFNTVSGIAGDNNKEAYYYTSTREYKEVKKTETQRPGVEVVVTRKEWVTTSIKNIVGGPNTISGNIFGNSKDTWSNPYYLSSYVIYPPNRGGRRHIYVSYTNVNVRNKFAWDNDKTVITPYYVFNRFPFRYVCPDMDFSYKNTINNVSIKEAGGSPMPSIDKNKINIVMDNNDKNKSNKKIVVNIKTFDNDTGKYDMYNKYEIEFDFELRKCHMNYTGSVSNDSAINYPDLGETGGWQEVEGPVKKFDDSFPAKVKDFF
jgi:hypothetical protein